MASRSLSFFVCSPNYPHPRWEKLLGKAMCDTGTYTSKSASQKDLPSQPVANTVFHSAETLSKQQALVETFRRSMSENPEFFKRVYKNTFLLARTAGQKSLALDTAIEYWRLLLQAPSKNWATIYTPWLEWWITYLEERWRKSVNKDMWEQTGAFVLKSLEDDSMKWWSEDGAWPSVLDDFVGYVRERRRLT